MGKGKVYCYKHCYFCNYKVPPEARGEYSFHRFPRDPAISKLWKEFCNLTDIDDARNLYLCSKHFKRSDFILVKSQQPGNGGARLVKDAVPIIRTAATPPLVENEEEEEEEEIKPVQLEIQTDLPPEAFDIELSIPTQIVVKKDSNPSTTAELTNLASLLTNIHNLAESPAAQRSNQTHQFVLHRHQAIFIPDPATVISVVPSPIQYTTQTATLSAVPSELSNQIQFLSETEQAFADAQEFLRKETKPVIPEKKVKYRVPKHLDSTNTSDVVTPKKPKKTIKFFKRSLAKKSKQVMVLRRNFRRLRKRMEFCKQVVADLKDHDVLSEDVANRLIQILRT